MSEALSKPYVKSKELNCGPTSLRSERLEEPKRNTIVGCIWYRYEVWVR